MCTKATRPEPLKGARGSLSAVARSHPTITCWTRPRTAQIDGWAYYPMFDASDTVADALRAFAGD